MNAPSDAERYDDEITLKELILKIKEFWAELWRHWILIGLICIPFLAYKFYQAWSAPTTYPARLTFMVDQDEGQSLGGMASILGQFGLGGMRPGKYNLDKILEISKSRRVLQMALFAKVDIEGQQDFLANHLIHYFALDKEWRDDTTGLKDFRFTRSDVSDFGLTEKKVLKSLQGLLVGGEKTPGVYTTSYNEDTGIMTLGLDAPQQDLSIMFTDTVFARLRDYYIEKSIEKSRASYQVIKEKTDSLAQALSAAEYSLAEFMDRNQNVFSAREGTLRRTRLSSQVQKLQIIHGEALKNQQIAELALKNRTPFITLIDNPLAPIKPQKESLIKALLIGLILGGMIGTAFVFLRKIYRDAMAT